jgi:hypothetical protein
MNCQGVQDPYRDLARIATDPSSDFEHAPRMNCQGVQDPYRDYSEPVTHGLPVRRRGWRKVCRHLNLPSRPLVAVIPAGVSSSGFEVATFSFILLILSFSPVDSIA